MISLPLTSFIPTSKDELTHIKSTLKQDLILQLLVVKVN